MLNDDWVKLFARCMTGYHSNNENVQLAALRTIWLILTLNSTYSYAIEFASRDDGLNALVTSMKNHQNSKQIQHCGSGIIACLAHKNPLHNKSSLLLSFENGAVIERVGMAFRLYPDSHTTLHAFLKLLIASLYTQTSSEDIIKTIAQCTNREHQGNDMLISAIETVLNIMIDCQEDIAIQIWGCWLIWALMAHHESLLDLCDKSKVSATIGNILVHLQVIAAPLGLYEHIICLLSAISYCNEDILAGKEEDISKLTLQAMLAEPQSRTVIYYGCHCICSNIYCIQNDTAGIILRAMKDFDDETIAEIAITSLMCLAKSGYNSILALLHEDRLIDTIVECMMRHPNASSIQIAACDIFSAIALDRKIMRRIDSSGGATSIISTMYNLRNDPEVVSKAFVALANITDASILRESRAPRSIICAMEANNEDLYIQYQGLTALWNLASMNDSLKKEIVQNGGIEIISKAMANFLASEQIQEQGIVALWTLTSSMPLPSSLISCTVEAVANAMSAHLQQATICQQGLGSMSILANFTSAKADDMSYVIDLIFSCMWMHSEIAAIQQGALGALTKVSVNKTTNQVMQITSEDVDVITNAMRTHLSVKDVQENAIVLLRSLTYNHVNVEIMGQNPHLVELIKNARSHFQLRFHVDDLLRLLQSESQ